MKEYSDLNIIIRLCDVARTSVGGGRIPRVKGGRVRFRQNKL